MKKLIALLLTLSLVWACAGCGQNGSGEASETTQEAEATHETLPDGTAIMNYEDYTGAESGAQVCVDTYVQARQAWASDRVTIYAQDEDGAYYISNMACTESDYEKLVPGTRIRVTGFKSPWEGGYQIVAGTFEILGGEPYIAEPLDVTEMYESGKIQDNQNRLVSIRGMTVEPLTDAGGSQVPFVFGETGTGEAGLNDLYFNASMNGITYSFTVLCNMADADVYQAAQSLQIGQTIDVEGFMMYPGVAPHVTSVTIAQ